jgi:hypothetical protein
MTPYTGDDASADGLKRLAHLMPDADRAARVRARCRAQLERRQRRTARPDATSGVTWRVLAPLAVGGCCLFYAIGLLAATLDLRSILY